MNEQTMDQIIRHIDFNDSVSLGTTHVHQDPATGSISIEDAKKMNIGPTPTMGQPLPPAQEPSPLDVQVGGDHYKKLGHFQPWEVAAAWLTPEELRGAMKFTVISYLAREQDKGGDKDIEKAAHTIQLWQAVRKDKSL